MALRSEQQAKTSRWSRNVAAFIVTTAIIAVGVWRIRSFVHDEAAYLEAASSRRDMDRKCVQVVRAQESLLRLGARFWDNKGQIFNEIDLTSWRGNDDDLHVLQPFVFLEELGADYEYTCGSCDRQWLVIDASNTALTDAAVPYLVKLTNLRALNIGGTYISDEGVRRLQQALPLCKIVKDKKAQTTVGLPKSQIP